MAELPAEAEDGSGPDEYYVEPLATGRERRSTAGRLMNTLLDAEADDELARIFAEEEDDEEFESGDGEEEGGEEAAADDMELDSSSSDEGDEGGPADAGNDELEGEKELQRQEKAERAKKRTAQQEGFRIPAQRKKKTMQNRVQTHARLKRSEQKRVQLIATMEETAKRKEKARPKQMTQADRLAEAEKTERLNFGSLTRWEEMEEKRGEERRLKMEALHNRRLEGPVITFWSGIAKWINEKLAMAGIKTFRQAADTESGRKKKGRASETGREGQPTAPGANKATEEPKTAIDPVPAQPTDGQPAPKEPSSFLDGIHLYASMEEASTCPDAEMANAATTSIPKPDAPITETIALPNEETHENESTQSAVNPGEKEKNEHERDQGQATDKPLEEEVVPMPQEQELNAEEKPDKDKPVLERSSRTCIVLDNFDASTAPERSDVGVLYNPKKPVKLPKTQAEFCPITSHTARYRDPTTGLPYSNSLAYREIRQVLAHRYAWSGTFGCFVGPIGVGARGVPERFLAPNAAPPQQLFEPGDGDGKPTTAAGDKSTAQ
ncbi:hypothetical protein MGYG_03144 [Nannizzia gypsea CBS 118893]|uniref:Vps72/YL1 C-terminal domain-containing protein n=1 Tax=Arthroderma gypseum (strain ATCC MYA-4604 / CBS 118893) TaxID=535722 RepID=E4UR23_ARTGP|nr:hypothetical protein MGYG_03144 [Nannizzia gypsea CBS 118893]EFR00138.1 hypothetical protein MGYG_03144 [Nannizzia gypsea CBS 118893]